MLRPKIYRGLDLQVCRLQVVMFFTLINYLIEGHLDKMRYIVDGRAQQQHQSIRFNFAAKRGRSN